MEEDYPRRQPSPSPSQDQQPSNHDQKQPFTVFVPPQFNKAKRNITKLVNNYFTALKEYIKAGAKLNIDRSKLSEIQTALTAYVGLRFNDKKVNLDLKLKLSEESKSKDYKSGVISYVSQAQKMIWYTSTGKVNVINLHKDNFRIPDLATPVILDKNVYLLDPCNYDIKRKSFVPEGPAFCIGTDGKMKQITPPILFRNKCAIAKNGVYVYIIGGEATERKILTNRCEKYNLKTCQTIEIQPMKHKHRYPSACFINQQLWVFSMFEVQMYDGKEWTDIGVPFGVQFLPFQFTIPVNQHEILIFGGVSNNEKSREVKIYNTKYKNINYYGRLLPQGISNQRNSGASVVHGCVAAISSIQASVYPQVGVKSNMTEVLYIFESSAYLNSIITL